MRQYFVLTIVLAGLTCAVAQEDPVDKRVFGVLPNYRTANESATYAPISTHQKFVIASKDSFDYPLVMLGGAFAALGQLSDQNPSFGQGLAGYAREAGDLIREPGYRY